MKKFVTRDMVNKELEIEIEFAKKNGSIDAYEDVPGKQAFRDGVYQGTNNSYVRAVADVKRYLKSIVESNPDLKVSDVLNKIVYQ
jgi:hypothetical protein